MNVFNFVAKARNHYVEQFRDFIAKQKRTCVKGASEVKLQLKNEVGLFQRIYCIDFIRNDDEFELIELQPDKILKIAPITGSFGDASISIEDIHWDDVNIHHDLELLPPGAVAEWFDRWLDPEDKRQVRDAELSNNIHSLIVRPNMVSIDFGTAEPDAFWEMLELIEAAGASTIRVICTSEEPEAD